MATTARASSSGAAVQSLPFIISASSVGTLIEWYDFYLYGVLAVFFSKHFFSSAMDPNVAFIASLFVFWTGFLVRPVRRHRVRPFGRPHRPEVHFHA